jgi:hypothetical protein
MPRGAVSASAFLLLSCLAANAQTADPDLARIPAAAAPTAPAPTDGQDNIYLENYLAVSALRSNLAVPLPPPGPAQWEARLFLDARIERPLANDLGFFYSGRLNVSVENDAGFPSHHDVRNDLREAYLAWRGADGLFVEFGRINLKSGMALGFNPTDFFKTRAVVDPVSADPTVLREDRLGTLMLQAQKIWNGGSLMAAIAPKLAEETAPYTNTDLPSFNPMFDRTNAHTRALVKASIDVFDGISPEFLIYNETDHTRFGLNLTQGFGQAIVGYLEWAGGRRSSLAYNAYADGVLTGVLPPGASIPVDAQRSFANDLAVGASYATKIGVTFDLEYDFHQAGFSAADWRNWFDAGAANTTNQPVLGELWFLRGYAGDQQEPVARNSIFLSANWPHAFVHDLSLAGFVDTDLRDGSGLAQFTANYDISPQWTVGVLTDAYFGAHRSDFGSLPQQLNILASVSRFF